MCVHVFLFTLSPSLLHCYGLNAGSTRLCRCVVQCGRRIGRAWLGRHSCKCCWGGGQAACNESNAHTYIPAHSGKHTVEEEAQARRKPHAASLHALPMHHMPPTPDQVEEAINFLCGEGHIYSTVDDYTHRSCQNM